METSCTILSERCELAFHNENFAKILEDHPKLRSEIVKALVPFKQKKRADWGRDKENPESLKKGIQRTLRNWANKNKRTQPTPEYQQVIFETMVRFGIDQATIQTCGFQVQPDSSLASHAQRLNWQDTVSSLEIHCLKHELDYLESERIDPSQLLFRQLFLQSNLLRLSHMFPHPGTYQESMYVARDIDQYLVSFCEQESARNILMVVNNSGVGKTTSLLNQANRLWLNGNTVFFLNGADFEPPANLQVESEGVTNVAEALGWSPDLTPWPTTDEDSIFRNLYHDPGNAKHWRELNEHVRSLNRDQGANGRRSKDRICFFIDAMDRFNGSPELLLGHFTAVLEFLSRHDQFKIVISCRREVWDLHNLANEFVQNRALAQRIVGGQRKNLLEFRRVGSCRMEQNFTEGGYSKTSFKEALRIHADQFGVMLVDGDLQYSDEFYEIANHPLFMRLFFEANRGKRISLMRPPRIWNTYFRFMGKKREQFRKQLVKRLQLPLSANQSTKNKLDLFITRVVLQCAVYMFCQGKTEVGWGELSDHLLAWLDAAHSTGAKFSSVLDASLVEEGLLAMLTQGLPPELPSEILTIEPRTLVNQLLTEAGNSGLLIVHGDQIRFDYDWYFEFCLGRALGNRFLADHQQIQPIIDALARVYRRDQRNILESLRFSVLHCEFAEDGDTFTRVLRYLAEADFDFQQVACRTVKSLNLIQNRFEVTEISDGATFYQDEIFSYSPRLRRYCGLQNGSAGSRRKLETIIEAVVDSILANSVEAVAAKGDFVCRFDLCDSLQTIRENHPRPVHRLLKRWCFPKGEISVQRRNKSKDNSMMLRMVAAIDVLRGGTFEDINLLGEILKLQTPDDPEWQFWSRRFAAVSINQIYSAAQASKRSTSESDASMSAYDRIGDIYHELFVQHLKAVEKSMLLEQFLKFVEVHPAISNSENRWQVFDEPSLSTSLSTPWCQVAWYLGLINLNNRWIRGQGFPADHAQFIDLAERTHLKIQQESETSGPSVVRRSVDVFAIAVEKMLAHPHELISEDDLGYGVTKLSDWSRENPSKMAIGYSPEFLAAYHLNHHECRERLFQIVDRLESASREPNHSLFNSSFYEPSRVEEYELITGGNDMRRPIHEVEYLDRVRDACSRSDENLSFVEVEVRPGSLGAALRSAGALKDAVEFAQRSSEKVAACINRPPGHLAENQICIFDNIAVGVRQAQSKLREQGKSPRVLVIDLDAHHGQHIQRTFYEDPDVTFFSIHQDNVHPGSGFVDEIGRTRFQFKNSDCQGLGTNVNVPIPPFTKCDAYRDILSNEMVEVIESHEPLFIFVALGVDGDVREPFAALELTPGCFFHAGRLIRKHRKDGVPVVTSFEGGFCIGSGAIADCVEGFLVGLASDDNLPTHLADRSAPPDATIQTAPEPNSPLRSFVCHDHVATATIQSFAMTGSVETVLHCACDIDGLERIDPTKQNQWEFGLGAGSGQVARNDAIDDIGEVILIAGRPFCQSPNPQQVNATDLLWTPFLVGWSGRPPLWIHVRMNSAETLKSLMHSLDQALDIDCSLFGLCGFLRVPLLKEKRLCQSPSTERKPNSESTDRHSYPTLLRPEYFSRFFTSDVADLPPPHEMLAISGLLNRPQGGHVCSDTQRRLFYRSPLSVGSGGKANHHIHGLVLPRSAFAADHSPFVFDDLQAVAEAGSGLMATHLEDDTQVTEAYLGVCFLGTADSLRPAR